LKSILEYLGPGGVGKVTKGAKDAADAVKKLKASGDNFERPVVSFSSLPWMR
jgi:hypothetical protein